MVLLLHTAAFDIITIFTTLVSLLGSDYTVLVALADPNDYDGGNFTLFPDGVETPTTKISIKPKRLSAIVFLSEFTHGVESCTPGRKMMTNELWRYDDTPVFVNRPTPASHVFGNPNSAFAFDEDHYPHPHDGDGDDDYGDEDDIDNDNGDEDGDDNGVDDDEIFDDRQFREEDDKG